MLWRTNTQKKKKINNGIKKHKFGEAFASCILDIRKCLSVIAYAYMLSKLKDEEVLFNNPKLED